MPESLIRRFGTARRLVCAPERRTRQTAEWFGTDVQVDQALRDCDWGRWHGQSIKVLQVQEPEALQIWLEDSDAAPHGGESVSQLGERAAAWLTTLQATPGHVMAVTHPFFIRAVLMHVLQGASFHGIDVEPLAVVELSFAGRWRLRLCAIDAEGAER